jgi:phosphinothricin acetyltransferase
MRALAGVLRERGYNKLVSHVFADNAASRRMLAAVGFREVGVFARHGELDGRYRDVVAVELLL